MSAPYIGPERRKGQRRDPKRQHVRISNDERRGRLGEDRRQEALAGVLVGFSAEDMEVLAGLWRAAEEGRVIVQRPRGDEPGQR